MGGMMAPAYLILIAIACGLALPILVAVIAIITELGKAMGL